MPSHHETAGRQDRDVGHVLTTRRTFVDLELAAQLGAAGVETLAEDPPAGTILPVSGPDHDKVAVGRHRDPWFITDRGIALLRDRGGVDQKGGPKGVRSGVIQAAEHPISITIVTGTIVPHDNHLAGSIRGNVAVVLTTALAGAQAKSRADQHLATKLVARVVEALHENVVADATGVAVAPNDGETAVIARHRSCVLSAASGGIDHEIAALGSAIRRKALGNHAIAGAVDTRDILPGDNEATIRQGGNVGLELIAVGHVIDAKLWPHGHTIGAETLGIDAVAVGVVLTIRLPHDHVAAVIEDGDLRFFLGAGGKRIDPLGHMHFRLAIELKGNVDRHARRGACASVSIGDAQGHRARRLRTL